MVGYHLLTRAALIGAVIVKERLLRRSATRVFNGAIFRNRSAASALSSLDLPAFFGLPRSF
jgi:hypothetical protein